MWQWRVITFIDADDWIESDYYEKQLKYLDNADLLICDRVVEDASGTHIVRQPVKLGIYTKSDRYLHKNWFRSNDGYSYGIAAFLWDKMFRAELLKAAVPYVSDDILISEDRCFFTYVMLHSAKIVICDIVVTEKCSLRCGKCFNLMQYYKFPRNFDVFETKEMLDKSLNTIDMIYELRILGGEPFMNKDFFELIGWYVDHEKIKKIAIFTNATIFPSEEKRKVLINPKIIMKISDYEELSIKLYDWVKWCENNHVEYMVSKLRKWQDCGNLEKHNYREEELKYLYRTCECRDLPTLINGKLYNCPYAANAVNLGALDDDEAEKDSLDLMDKSHLKE